MGGSTISVSERSLLRENGKEGLVVAEREFSSARRKLNMGEGVKRHGGASIPKKKRGRGETQP